MKAMTALELLRLILTHLPSQPNGWVFCTRSDLTKKFCHHPNRPGSLTTADLARLVPLLVGAGLASEIPRPGKPAAFIFRPVTFGEYSARKEELDDYRRRNPPVHGDTEPILTPAAWAEIVARRAEDLQLFRAGPNGGSPRDYNPLKRLASGSSTGTEEKKCPDWT